MGVKETIIPSAARTAAAWSALQRHYSPRGAILRLSVTAAPNTAETLTVYAFHVNAAGAAFNGAAAPGKVASAVSVAGSALQAGGSALTLTIAPGLSGTAADAASVIYSGLLPPEWIALVNPSSNSSWTYQLEVFYL
jgi:hypothetical protein